MTDTTAAGMPAGEIHLVDRKYCSGCGTIIHKAAPQCPRCGAPQADANVEGTKSRTTAAILAFFLGGIGVHKFYLGRIGWGTIYLLFCWTFIPAIVAFIEFIIYLTMSDAAFKKKYG